MTVSRRMFLRGAGGRRWRSPCLTSLLSRDARAQYVPPKRFVTIAADHGVYEQLWYPTGYKRQLPAGATHTSRDLSSIAGSVSDIIGPQFDGLKSKLLLIRGLDSALHFPNSNGHMRSTTLCGTYLGGTHPGSSVDVVLSKSPKVKRAETTLSHVSCGVWGENHSFELKNGSMNQPFMYSDGKQLFDYLFAGFSPTASEGERIKRRRLLLMDSVLENYREVSRSARLGSADKRVLDEFVTGFASVEQRIKNQGVGPSACSVTMPPFGTYDAEDVLQYERRINEMLDILALALKCGVVQVAQFGLPTPEDSRPPPASNYAVFKNLNSQGVQFTLPIHDYSHEAGAAQTVLPSFQRWLARFVARFMTSLDTPEGSGSNTFLDNSLVLYQNNLSNGSLHLRYDLPVLAGGSLGGRFATGKFFDYTQNIQHTVENNNGRSVGMDYNRFLVGVLQGFGLSEPDYQQPGQPPGFGSDTRHGQLHSALDTSQRRVPLPGLLVG